MKDLKYLLAYIVPLSAALALAWQGPWAWATVVLAFVVIPVLEILLPRSAANVAPALEESRSKRIFFNILLYLNFPILFALLGWYFSVLQRQPFDPAVFAGLTLSMGVIAGSIGINVAHELGHRVQAFEQWMSKCMLMPSLYQHFFIEHNLGHHKNVGTDLDPASARRGEWLFRFWVRSITGSWRHAWQLERMHLQKTGRTFWSLHNRMLRFQVWQALWLVGVGVVFGPLALAGTVAVALISVLLLETINYVEHYGLRRRQLPSGQYEPVTPAHSWNSDHEVGRILLYELTRHSDHHYKSTRKYQILRHLDKSPQLPFGYPTSILIALAPPLWFRVMDRELEAVGAA